MSSKPKSAGGLFLIAVLCALPALVYRFVQGRLGCIAGGNCQAPVWSRLSLGEQMFFLGTAALVIALLAAAIRQTKKNSDMDN